jgi:hypothetical protein
VGWADYDMFEEWQSAGGKVEADDVPKTKWNLREQGPRVFRSEDGEAFIVPRLDEREISAKNKLQTLRQKVCPNWSALVWTLIWVDLNNKRKHRLGLGRSSNDQQPQDDRLGYATPSTH